MFRIWPRFKAGQSYVETIQGVGPMGQSFLVVLNQFCRDSSWVLLLRNSDLPINKQVTAIHIRGIALTEFRRFRFSLDSHKSSRTENRNSKAHQSKCNQDESNRRQASMNICFAFNVYTACKHHKGAEVSVLCVLVRSKPSNTTSWPIISFFAKKNYHWALDPNYIYPFESCCH